MKKIIALAGNPNSGKTSLFNELTGANQYVGNWPGVTVERKGGRLKEHEEIELQDLPGIYSLSPYSPEEVISRRFLVEEKPDMVIDVVDATNLERNLYLTSQLLETGLPVVVALNMMDLVEERGEHIDADALSKRLGCPVVKVSALRQTGLAALVHLLSGELPAAPKPLPFAEPVEKAIAAIGQKYSVNRWMAVKLLEGDTRLLEKRSREDRHAIEDIRLGVEKELGDDIASIIASGRYDAICSFIPEVLTHQSRKATLSERLDAVLTHRVAGLAIFVAVMWAIYYISINTVGDWGTGWANDVLFGPVVGGWLEGFIGGTAASAEALTMFSAVLAMVLVFPSMLRRIHDLGLNGSWLYLVIAPFLLEYMCPHLPDTVHSIIMYVLYAFNALLLLACLLAPGKKGSNRYGSGTASFTANPFSLNGRAGRVEFIIWFVALSAISFGVALLGTLQLECSPQINDLITNGIVAGVGSVLGFLPQMAVLFLLLSLLEDCGYMARVAFMMDRIFRAIGLSGRSFIPLLVSMGCGVPGVMATRTIENEKDRRMTIMLTTFIPCGAKLPIIALLGAVIGQSATIATIAYFTGIGSVIIGGLMLRKTHAFAGSYTPFVMELPAYHTPRGANINMRAMERCKAFVRKAGTIIFLASALIWFTSNYNWKMEFLNTAEDEEAIETSMLADVGHQLAPLFAPLGWGDWRPAVASITGLIAKENVVGTFGVLYAGADEKEEDAPAGTPETEDAEAPAPAAAGLANADEAAAAPAEAPAEGEPALAAASTEEEAAEEEEDELPRSSDLTKGNAFTALVMAAWQCDKDVREAAPAEAAAEEEEEGEEGEEALTGNWFLDTMNYFFGAEEDEETTGVAANIQKAGAFTTISGLSFMLFNLLCAPCFAACGAIRREMNSARWTWFAIGYMCVWAYIVAFIVYQMGLWMTTGAFETGQIIACLLTMGIIIQAVRPNPHKNA